MGKLRVREDDTSLTAAQGRSLCRLQTPGSSHELAPWWVHLITAPSLCPHLSLSQPAMVCSCRGSGVPLVPPPSLACGSAQAIGLCLLKEKAYSWKSNDCDKPPRSPGPKDVASGHMHAAGVFRILIIAEFIEHGPCIIPLSISTIIILL